MPASNSPKEISPNRGSILITLVAIDKLLKATVLFALGLGAVGLLNGNAREILLHWTHAIRIDPDNHYAHTLISKITGLTPRRLELMSFGTFAYGSLFTIEGIGLLCKKRWAEYVTVISTAGFLPIEAYEIYHHTSAIKIVVLVVNVLIVIYLIARLRGELTSERRE